jgi:FeS assembly protein IscX
MLKLLANFIKIHFMKWIDSLDIAIALDEKYPNIDPLSINFVELRDKVLSLDEFDDDKDKSGEKILEAIQGFWIEEKD